MMHNTDEIGSNHFECEILCSRIPFSQFIPAIIVIKPCELIISPKNTKISAIKLTRYQFIGVLSDVEILEKHHRLYFFSAISLYSSLSSNRDNYFGANYFDGLVLYHINFKLSSNESFTRFTESLLLFKHESIHGLELFQKPLLIFVNPTGGNGKGAIMFKNYTSGYLKCASINYKLVITKKQHEAYDYVVNASTSELLSYRAICLVSGDGLMFEVANALKMRLITAKTSVTPSLEQETKIIAIPLFHIPAGTSNATAASIAFHSSLCSQKNLVTSIMSILTAPIKHLELTNISSGSDEQFWSQEITPVDALLVQSFKEDQRRVGILSVTWGVIADIDIGFEFLRCLGRFRNSVGGAIMVLQNPKGAVTFSFLTKDSVSLKGDAEAKSHDFCWNFCPDINDPIPSNWTTIKGNFSGISLMIQSHLASNALLTSRQRFGCGYISAFIHNEQTSRSSMLHQFDAFQSGKGVEKSAFLDVHEIVAFRLIPEDDRKSYIVVDGEVIPYGPVQGEILPKRFNLITGPKVRHPENNSLVPVNLQSVFPNHTKLPYVCRSSRIESFSADS